MRYQYRITFAEGNTGTCPSPERIYDPLFYFREKFGTDRILRVEERYGEGEYVPSELLPTSEEEADTVNSGPIEELLDGAA